MNPAQANLKLMEMCRQVPVIPVLEVEDEATAEPLAAALSAGGLTILEVTLRTRAALSAIKTIARMPGCTVGAGSVLNSDQVAQVKAAGAQFAVSPGFSETVMNACMSKDLPLLPGAATATEIMALLAKGFQFLKFFPAEVSGGLKALKAFSGPLPAAHFCPTGGIGPGNFADYLALPNVVCVGGSWVAPRSAINSGDWETIRRLASEAS